MRISTDPNSKYYGMSKQEKILAKIKNRKAYRTQRHIKVTILQKKEKIFRLMRNRMKATSHSKQIDLFKQSL